MAAPDPYVNSPTQVFTASNWREDLRNGSPNGAGMFGANGGECALVGTVDFNRSIPAQRFFLGYATVTDQASPNADVKYLGDPSTSGPYFLNRTPPVYHPRYPRCTCVSVACEDYVPNGRTIRAGKRTAKIVETALPRTPNDPGNWQGWKSTIEGTPLGFMTAYSKSRITARFAPAEFPMLKDTNVLNPLDSNDSQEWRRWTIVTQTPTMDVLTLDGFQLLYTEGTGNTGDISNPYLNKTKSSIGQVLVKSDVQIQWLSVPDGWIFTLDSSGHPTFFPKNILKGLGTVNDANFMSYLKGTLLFKGVRMIRKAWPLAAGSEFLFNYDLTFNFEFFNPEKGFKDNSTRLNALNPDGEPTYIMGHNCMPWQGNFMTGDINAGLWFGSTYNGATNGTGQFRSSSFPNLFKCASDPS